LTEERKWRREAGEDELHKGSRGDICVEKYSLIER
jgi:hypothetical protein